MGRKVLMLLGATSLGVMMAAPASATSINVNTTIPVRPHVHLNAPLHIDVRPRIFPDLDLSDACSPDQKFKPGKRHRRCRQQR